ncbi:CDK5 and ABL1 enzyme substrate 1 [Mortierella claussenii]|nr:CDK5 and ABL1 enzyme substrate 1 [Mortierella claussenii]
MTAGTDNDTDADKTAAAATSAIPPKPMDSPLPSRSISTNSIRRRASNRQAAFSFLSSIQLDPATRPRYKSTISNNTFDTSAEHPEGPQGVVDANDSSTIVLASPQEPLDPSLLTLPLGPKSGNSTSITSKEQYSTKDNFRFTSSPTTSAPSAPTDMRPSAADNRRSQAVGKKEEAATTFLSTISLRGETFSERAKNEESGYHADAPLISDMEQRGSHAGQDIGYPIAANRPTVPVVPSQGDLIPHRSVQRSSSTPSLASSWARTPSDYRSDALESSHSGRRRKATNPSAYPARNSLTSRHRSSPFTKQTTTQNSQSPGLLSALLARESDTDTRRVDLSNSCVSIGENLSQHAYMFTTKHGSPLVVSSILRYNDDKAPNKRRRRRFDREYLQQITKEALVRRKANSFAHLLTQSNALSPEQEDASSYDPYYLDDPELKTGKNRTVISLACYMATDQLFWFARSQGSVIQYTRPSDLKRELNEHFRSRHPTIDPSITLSKIRKVKTDLLAISEELDLEISTAALAYAYFEKLILKDEYKGKESSGILTDSTTSPVNEPKRTPGEFTTLMKQMSKHMDVSAKDIKEHEFQVFSLLDFNLYLPRQEFLPHFEQILYRQDYLNVQEYLGEDEFYSVAPQQRKVTE